MPLMWKTSICNVDYFTVFISYCTKHTIFMQQFFDRVSLMELFYIYYYFIIFNDYQYSSYIIKYAHFTHGMHYL